MIFLDFFKAIAQMGDPRFMRVFWRGVFLTIALLIAAYALMLLLLNQLGQSEWLITIIGDVTWVGSLLNWGGLFLMAFFSIVLMVPVASTITSLFLNEVADAVESVHYPNSPSPQIPFWDGLRDTLNFLGLLLVVNIAALIVAILIPPLSVFIFWGANGYMLGREYFSMVAIRKMRRTEVKAMFKRYRLRIWFAGILMAIPLSIPLLNLFIPILGAATFTHQFHRLRALTSD